MNAKASLFKWFAVLLLTIPLASRAEVCAGKAEFSIDALSGSQKIKKPEYVRHGRTFVEGRPGEAYSIHFKNNSPGRVLVIVSVDGLDVLEGKTATAESSGYVVEGNNSLEIKGWRTSTSEVRQFFFDQKKDSYAAGTGHDTKNCGVIACKVFAQKPLLTYQYPPPPPVQSIDKLEERLESEDGLSLAPEARRRLRSVEGGLDMPKGASANSTLSRGMPSRVVPEFKLGTGWGAPVRDFVRETTFDRGEVLTTMNIYYSDAESLERIGIALHPKPAMNPELPQAFAEFCPPPKFDR